MYFGQYGLGLLHSEQTPMNETDKLLRDLTDLVKSPDMNPGAVCHLNKTGKILLANKAARQLFGNENIAGQNWNNICPEFGDRHYEHVNFNPV